MNSKNSVLVIPARYASKRLPGKALIEIKGKSVLLRTYEQCIKAFPSGKIFVATDDKRIRKHCEANKIQVVMTSANCLTGTDRIAEFSKKIDADYYINVQGDEPLMNPKDISDVVDAMADYPGQIINGYAEIKSQESYRSPNIPKVVKSRDNRLLYMSRSPIPGNKEGEFRKAWRQICVYAFPKQALLDFYNFGKKSELEEQEDIEILRFLEMGYNVRMIPLSSDSIAVDTPEDVEKVKEVLRR